MTYRLLTYAASTGPRPGLLVDEQVFDLQELKPSFPAASVRQVLYHWDTARSELKSLAEKAPKGSGRPLATTKLCAPILYPGGLFCATLLTLFFLPALYAIWYRIKPRNGAEDAHVASGVFQHVTA